MKTAFFTICARNYLAYALTLRESLLAQHAGAAFFIVLADAPVEGAAPVEGIIGAEDLALPDFDDMAFRYTVMEFATAVKPFAFRRLFAMGFEAAVYLDPDILVTAGLDPVRDALEAGAEAALTPHMLAPFADDARPTDRDILASGVFNLGFAAFRATPSARAFLDWWAERLAKDCFADPAAGLFVDQRFADLAPAFIERLAILRDRGLNVAYWNLHERPLSRDATGALAAGGARLRFFHFSGVVPGDASVFSKHQTRWAPKDLGPGRALLEDYLGRLCANGHEKWSKTPYAYDLYTDGSRIPAPARRLYARGALVKKDRFAPDRDFLNAPAEGVAQDEGAITRLMAEIARARPDVGALHPLSHAQGRAGFRRWFALHGAGEYALDPAYVAPALAGGTLAAEKKLRGGLKKIRDRARRLLARG